MNRKYFVRGVGSKQRSIAMPINAEGYYDRIDNPTMDMLSKLPKGSILFIPDNKKPKWKIKEKKNVNISDELIRS